MSFSGLVHSGTNGTGRQGLVVDPRAPQPRKAPSGPGDTESRSTVLGRAVDIHTHIDHSSRDRNVIALDCLTQKPSPLFCCRPPSGPGAKSRGALKRLDATRRAGVAMAETQAACDELYVYTIGRSNFILQNAVDAQMAQTATETSRPIGIVFALVGLYLHVEKGFTGAQVQQVHRRLGQTKRAWPRIDLPSERGGLTASDVMRAPAGAERDAAISQWCDAVWKSFRDRNRAVIVELLSESGIVPASSV